MLDYFEQQLESERMAAERKEYDIRILRADMAQKIPLANENFGLIFHPVSNCYIEDVCYVWRECFRLLRPGGIPLAGMDNGIHFLFEDEPLVVKNKLPFNPFTASEADYRRMVKNHEGIQFFHTLEEQIAGQLHAGFRLMDLYEGRDRPGGEAIGEYAPQYITTHAVKPKE